MSALALATVTAGLGCQRAATTANANVTDAVAPQDAAPDDDDAGTLLDATLFDAQVVDARAPIDAAHNADASIDATMTTADAIVASDAMPQRDAELTRDAAPDAAPDAALNDDDAAAPMCRTSGPCVSDDECCWFCHDYDHCH